MFNRPGVRKETMTAPVQILFNVQNQMSVPILVDKTIASAVTVGDRKIVKAGTPLYGSLEARTTPFTNETTIDTGTKGVYTVQITTAAGVGDKITIEGTVYECAAAEDVAAKKFAGADAAAQVTSLLKMVVTTDFVVEAVTAATDKIKFTQKVAKTGDAPVVTATPVETTGTLVVGDVTEVTAGDTGTQTSNAVGVALHDVDVTAGNANATLLIFGFVNIDRLDTDVKALITPAVKAALSGKVTFLKDN